MSIETAFRERFGDADTDAIVRAANGHARAMEEGINRGSDPFKWILLECIGYECLKVESYRQYHGIATPWAELQKWIREHGQLISNHGEYDYLALLTGNYNWIFGREKETERDD